MPKFARKMAIGLATIVLLALVGLLAWQQRPHNKPADTKGPSIAVVPPKDSSRIIKEPLVQLVNGLVGQYIDQTSGSDCERIRGGANDGKQRCYQLNTILYLVDGNVTGNFSQFVDNCNKNGWTMDGQPLDANRLARAGQDSQMPNNLSAAAQSQMSFGLLTPNFFGEQDFLKKDNLGAVVRIYSLDPAWEPMSDADFLYALKAEIPAPDSYDFQGKIVDKLKANPSLAVLVIAAGSAEASLSN